MVITEIPVQRDKDYLNYVADEEEEWELIRDLHQEEIRENCFNVIIKNCKTGKKILDLITDQLTIDPEFDMNTGYDTLTIKVVLSEEYVEENGDPDFMEDLESFSKKYLEE